MARGFIFHFLFIIFYFNLLSCTSNKIKQGEILRDGDTLISPKKKFVLGFFSPKGSYNQKFLGIRYADVPIDSFVWVAIRGGATVLYGDSAEPINFCVDPIFINKKYKCI